MRLLLDEDVPEPLLDLLRHLLGGDEVQNVATMGWKGKDDLSLFRDSRQRFDAILTNNLSQLNDPDECRGIQRSGIHHTSYELDEGLDGLALASASICAAIRPVISALRQIADQRIVRIRGVARSRQRFDISNPAPDPPGPYWP